MDPRVTGTPPSVPPPPPPPPPPPSKREAAPAKERGLLDVLGDVVEAVAQAIDPPTAQALPESPLGRAAGTGELHAKMLAALGAPLTPAQQAADRALQVARNHAANADTANQWQTGRTDVLSGTQANQQITAGYAGMDQRFAQYVGGAVQPMVTNWMAFGKYASNEAGAQIRMLEKALNLLQVGPGTGTTSPSLTDVKQGLDEAFGERSLPMLTTLAKQYAATQGLADAALTLASPALGALVQSAGFARFAVGELVTMRNTLVAGNTGVYSNVMPAFEAFLAAEQAGGDGVAELKRLGLDPGPNQFLIKGFEAYREAKGVEGRMVALDAQLAGMPPGAARTALEQQRTGLAEARLEAMFRGNTMLGFKEQMDVLEKDKIFENNPRFQEQIKALGGAMKLSLADGKDFRMLPKGGDWTDFATRMGLEEVSEAPVPMPANVIKATTPQGRPTWFYLPTARGGAPEGTIADLFQRYAEGDKARFLHEGTPPRPREVTRVADLLP